VNTEAFEDYYELLQVSANADEDTIHRVFRHLAKRHHPDVPGQGDRKHFDRLVAAHRTLTNAETRAAYDVKYQRYWNQTWKVASDASDGQLLVDDVAVRERLLSLFYVQRRRSMRQPGMAELEIARLVGLPLEHVDFQLWYMREKGWIQRLENGMLAVTVDGVDMIENMRERGGAPRMIETREQKPDAGGNGSSGGRPPR
jgi:curved DNA-binding protein CbpA